MMYGNPAALNAASLRLHRGGMGGRYAQTMGSALGQQVGVQSLEAANLFVDSNYDLDKLYTPMFKVFDTLAFALPSPYSLFVKFGLNFAKQGADATRSALKTAARASGRYLPIEVGMKVVDHMAKSGPLTYWTRTARDKMAQEAGNSVLFLAALSAYNAVAPKDSDLNLQVRTRLSGSVLQTAVSKGAPTWAAAMVAWTIAKSMGADKATLDGYAAKVGAVTPEEYVNPEIVWKRKVGIVEQAGDLGAAGDTGSGSGILLGLGAVAAVFLASR